jgi:hypothetical protein
MVTEGEDRMTTDTERGLTELLEARRARIVTHTNVESVGVAEFRAFIDLALAADRRRQAIAECKQRDPNTEAWSWYLELVRQYEAAEDAALDKLLAHLAGEGVA